MKLIKLMFSGLPSWYVALALVLAAIHKAYQSIGNAGVVYYADNYGVPMPSCPFVGVSLTRDFKYTLTAAFILNDTIKLCRIPGLGTPIVITDYFIDVPDLDTSTGIALDLGDNTTAAKFTAASTVGQAVGKLTPAVNGVAASIPSQYTTAQDFVLKIQTAATGTAATSGIIKGWMRYFYVGAPSPI